MENLKNYYSNIVVRSLKEILDNCDSFQVIPFPGWVDMVIIIGKKNNCGSVHVPFLVTIEKLQQPILGFNANKVIMNAQKNTDALVKIFNMLFKSSNTGNVKKFVHLIQEPSDDKQVLVRVKDKNMIMAAGRIEVENAMLFQPGEIDVPGGLQYAETVVMLKPRANNYFKIPIVNDSNKNVMLHKNTQFGHLDSIKSIVSLQVGKREQPVVNTIILKEADKQVDKQTSKYKETIDQAEVKDKLPLT